jgi:hypothetical protein
MTEPGDPYRHGYAEAVRNAISAFVHKLTPEEVERVEDWFADALTRWSQGSGSEPPPDFPKLDS